MKTQSDVLNEIREMPAKLREDVESVLKSDIPDEQLGDVLSQVLYRYHSDKRAKSIELKNTII